MSTTVRNVSVVVSRPESSLFWMQIVHRLARELTLHGWNLMYTYLPSFGEEGYCLPPALTDGSVAGIIVLNIYSRPLLQLLGRASAAQGLSGHGARGSMSPTCAVTCCCWKAGMPCSRSPAGCWTRGTGG